MKKFQFSLETVLTYKQQVLEAVQNEHAILLKKMYDCQTQLENCWQRYRDYNEEYRMRSNAGMPITEALMYQSGLRALENEIQKCTKLLKEAQLREEKKRAEVVEAKKDTSSIEKLKDKKWTAYQKAVAKSEEERLEEFVSMKRVQNAVAV